MTDEEIRAAIADTLNNRRWDPVSGPIFKTDLVRKEDDRGVWLVVALWNRPMGISPYPTYSLVYCSQRQELLDFQYEDIVSRKGFVEKKIAANVLWPEEEKEVHKVQTEETPMAEVMVTATLEELEEGVNGGCLACGEVQYGGVEPDAEGYECGDCGERQVFGLEQLLIMGRLNLPSEE